MKSSELTRNMPRAVALLSILSALAAPGRARADEEEKVGRRRQLLPIFEGACVDCHGVKKGSGGLRLTAGSKLMAGGISGPVLVAKKPEDSYLLKRLRGEGDEDRMPLKGEA